MGGKGSTHVFPKDEHWSTYKIDGIKGLEEHKNSLARDGLKDPWIRNEVWRFREVLPTSRFGYMRVIGYAAVVATVMVLVRNNVAPRDKHNQPYLL
ncbi:uncharacterized protein LOC110458741 [Mizuhopecten yessoensis]|uniref:Uncharacterized protein n=1 Tax=Mizuhopecten yessoensis TaxID=6573 RepID=A0A210Q5Z6_MIZYE|nr:uncharacterized protein LOC110458741 [Mizuhopecten yessoensis]OWF44164.1 hypothetical protein KP79_PYT24138 [Mizuhopecten yessoensis]